VEPSGGDGLDVTLLLASRHGVEQTGAVPKGVSRSGFRVDERSDGMRFAFLIDV
jgi:hypothetical protein